MQKKCENLFACTSNTITATITYCPNSESLHFEFLKTTLVFWNISKIDHKNRGRSQKFDFEKTLFCQVDTDDFWKFSFCLDLYCKVSIFWTFALTLSSSKSKIMKTSELIVVNVSIFNVLHKWRTKIVLPEEFYNSGLVDCPKTRKMLILPN